MRTRIVICIIAAFILFQSSSPWEGAAAVAPEGELPASGRFIATNLFPRNTVVDITNIANNRSVRVIVANRLESPGLVALVSREAAEMIGMRPGSTSRIRMVQPSDPIAYLRFLENAATGIVGFDPQTEESLFEDHFRDDRYIPPQITDRQPVPVPPVEPPANGYVVENEWLGPGRFVDVPNFIVSETITPETIPIFIERIVEIIVEVERERIDVIDRSEIVKEVLDFITESSRDEVVKDVSEYMAHTDPEMIPIIVERIVEIVVERDRSDEIDRSEIVKDVLDYITETRRDEVIKDPNQFITEIVRDEVIKEPEDRITETVRTKL